MTEKKVQRIDGAELRCLAEEQLRENKGAAPPPGTEPESQRLLHELQVHQVELEMQNEELRQARAEEAAALGKYTVLCDFAPVGYFTLDRSGTIHSVNLTGANLMQTERSRLIGRRFGLLIAEDARPAFADFLEKVFTSTAKGACGVALLKDGNPQLVMQIEALVSESRNECRVAVINITERRLTEDALTEKRQELEEIKLSLGQAMDELCRKEQLLIMQSRHAAMGEMINNIAHQWRQPLNTLGLLIQQTPLLYGSAEFSREYLEENSRNAMQLIQHMSRTINDFKNFFKPDKEVIPFCVNEVIMQTISLVEDIFKAHGITVAFHTESDPMITGFPNEFAQVLLNILNNARDALVERNVDVPLITMQSSTEGGKSVVTITDNGGGISEEIMGKLFDPYFTTKATEKGTGIGLFMSKTIIEKNMGGRLTARNVADGAEFRIEV